MILNKRKNKNPLLIHNKQNRKSLQREICKIQSSTLSKTSLRSKIVKIRNRKTVKIRSSKAILRRSKL